jgi:hypothetical protein
VAIALAPVVFGFLADAFGHTGRHSFGRGTFGSGVASGAQGLEVTFLVMLLPLALAGGLLVRATRSYGGDVAGAMEVERRLQEPAAASGARSERERPPARRARTA